MSQDAVIGRLGQACDRWIYTACLCFGLDLAEQQASGFRYSYSVYQAEYSRNLIFASGARMDRVFGTIADRTRSRLDVPARQRRRFVSRAEFAAMSRTAPVIDANAFRADPDAVADQAGSAYDR